MKNKSNTALTAICFITFLFIISRSSDYLIAFVPAPQTQWIDLYTLVHAIAVGGTACFVLAFTSNNFKLRNKAFFALLSLIFIWEIIENTVLRETALAGQESLGNIGMDILIGILSMGMVLSTQFGFSYIKTKKKSHSEADLI